MDESDSIELSIDSLVDVIANTAGILIVLAMLPILLTQQQADVVDVGRAGLATLRADNAAKLQEITSQEDARKANKKELEKLDSELLLAKETLQDLKEKRAQARNQADRAESELTLAKQRLADLVRRETELQTKLQLAKARAKQIGDQVPPERRRTAAAQSLAELKSLNGELTAKIAAARAEASKRADERKALTAERKTLEDALKPLQDEIVKLRPKTVRSVSLRDVIRRRDVSKAEIQMECYRPKGADEADARVRHVNPVNYEMKGNKWFPRVPGENLAEMAKSGSQFQTFLKGQGADVRAKYVLYFQVRPDAYPSFRAARDLALDNQWDVRWEPIPPGDYISLGGY